MSDGRTTTPSGDAPRPAAGGGGQRANRAAPNYAARRMLVSTIAITAVIAVAVFGWRALTGSAETADSAAGGWDEIAVIDPSSGAIVVFDDEGKQLRRNPGTGRVVDVFVHDDRLALVGRTEIVLTDATEDGEPITVPIETGSVVAPIETATTLHLLVGNPAGGDLLIVDVDDGSVIDVGAVAAPTVPKLFVETVRVSNDGTTFAVADANGFQTIVVGDAIEGAVFLADQPIAVGDKLVATSQVVNLQADVALVDFDRTPEANGTTELPRGGLMIGDDLLMVSADGGVFTIGKGDREAEQIGSIAVPAGGSIDWARPSYLDERLVVAGATFEAVTDLDGNTLFTTTFTEPTPVDTPHIRWRCLPIGGGETFHSLVALESGEQLADLNGLAVTSLSADGCTVLGERGGVSEIVDADRSIRLGRLRNAVLSPDSHTVVWTTTAGHTELIRIEDDGTLADPISLTDDPTSPLVVYLRR